MRAFLIDPELKTITEIDHDGGYKNIQQLLGCSSITTGSRPLNGSMSKGFDSLYVSDDDIETLGEEARKYWFQVDADRDPPSSYPLTGKGLVVGTDTMGGDADAVISHDELTTRITFSKRKFRGFQTTTTRTGVRIDIKAPLLEEPVRKPPAMPAADKRPASWNAKMPLSGRPLITDAQFAQLLANGLEVDFLRTTPPVLKIFLPHIRWYLVGLGADLDSVFGVIDMGPKGIGDGIFSLAEIVNSRLGVCKPERDLYTVLDQPWPHYLGKDAA